MLTDLAIRRATPRQKKYKLHDAGGLYLLVLPSGARVWRFKYRRAGKESELALGTWIVSQDVV